MQDDGTTKYQVLARKYRPATFDDLKGQDAMVRTLRAAFETGRIAQAFILTGIRGTGKTTTARIIAKGMNCIGPDGNGGPTTDPCGVCPNCLEIAEGNHVDVMEIDAASNTGVQNVRDVIIETVAYAPAKARFKVFVIDEVHMLSTSAFNALLKTLEEPPEHVKFIFATTEIRKVPVTVLSRCQRFDLRRIEPEVMIDHLSGIAAKEGGQIDDQALGLIARAAEGSARDAVSLLDQALSHGAGETSADQVRAMLGLADRGRILDLFDLIMRGDAAGALAEISGQYADGADPLAILRDLAEVAHWVSVTKITPDAADDPTVSPAERTRGAQMAEALPMRALTRMWQMLLVALDEVRLAPNAMMAAEMAVIRLTHVAELPSPEELVRKLSSMSPPPSSPPPPTRGERPDASAPSPSARSFDPAPNGGGGPTAQAAPATVAHSENLARYQRFDQVVGLIRANRDVRLLVDVESGVRLVRYAPGRIEYAPTAKAPPDLAQRLARSLQTWTGARWGVSVVAEGGAPSIAEARDAERLALEEAARAHPLVAAVFDTFPNARIADIRTGKDLEAEAAADALPEVDEEWDPFEDS